MKTHPTAREVFTSALTNWRIVVLRMMIAILTTTTFYFVRFTRGRQDCAEIELP